MKDGCLDIFVRCHGNLADVFPELCRPKDRDNFAELELGLGILSLVLQLQEKDNVFTSPSEETEETTETEMVWPAVVDLLGLDEGPSPRQQGQDQESSSSPRQHGPWSDAEWVLIEDDDDDAPATEPSTVQSSTVQSTVQGGRSSSSSLRPIPENARAQESAPSISHRRRNAPPVEIGDPRAANPLQEKAGAFASVDQ